MGMSNVKVLLDFLTGSFVGVSGFLRQGVHPTVNIGVVPLIVVHDHIDYLLWCLRGGRVVQIHQGLSVHLPVKDGKILSNGEYVQSCLYHCKVEAKN